MEKGITEKDFCMCAEVSCKLHALGECKNLAIETRVKVIVWRLCSACNANFASFSKGSLRCVG